MSDVVRILIATEDWPGVTNGGFMQWTAATGPSARDFHLGEFVEVLTNTAWVGFSIELVRAHRTRPADVGLSEAALKADRGADVVGFRFDQPFTVNAATRSLTDFDMVLFFGINAVNAGTDLSGQAEVEAIGRFMEGGGGFFATGDHENLGAALCGRIPRVRSMR